MKQHKWTIFFTSLFFLIMTAGCSREFAQTEKVMSFKGNPTTGYTWTCVMEPEGIIDVSTEIFYLGDENTVGAPSLYRFTLTSLREGVCDLSFSYQRLWEKREPDSELLYQVSVGRNGKIRIKRK